MITTLPFRNKIIGELAEECGLVVDEMSPEATALEIEFLVEEAIKECAFIASENPDNPGRAIRAKFGLVQKINELNG